MICDAFIRWLQARHVRPKSSHRGLPSNRILPTILIRGDVILEFQSLNNQSWFGFLCLSVQVAVWSQTPQASRCVAPSIVHCRNDVAESHVPQDVCYFRNVAEMLQLVFQAQRVDPHAESGERVLLWLTASQTIVVRMSSCLCQITIWRTTSERECIKWAIPVNLDSCLCSHALSSLFAG